MYGIFDIIVLAAISVILGIKLFSLLGQKRGSDKSAKINNFKFKDSKTGDSKFDEESSDTDMSEESEEAPIKDVEMKLEKITDPEAKLRVLDPNFDKKAFINNVKEAYKIVLAAYAKGDTYALSDLLNIEMMRKFAYEISKRDDKEYSCEISIHKLGDVRLEKIEMEKYEAFITILFYSEVINHVEDKKHNTVSGDKTKVEKRQDEWTFSRNLRSQEPTWKLVKVNQLFS